MAGYCFSRRATLRIGKSEPAWIAIDQCRAVLKSRNMFWRAVFAARKSRNSSSGLYSNTGPKPMHGKRIVSSLYLYPGQTSAGTFVQVLSATVRDFSAMTMQLNPRGELKTMSLIPGFKCSVTTMVRSMNSTGRQCPRVRETIFHPAHDWNTIRDTMPLMYSTLTGIRSRSTPHGNSGASQFAERRR